MSKIELTDKRRRLLAYWYQHHKERNYWPTLRDASLDLGIPFATVQSNINRLAEGGWILKDRSIKQISLTKRGEASIKHAEDVSLGLMKRKTPNIALNKLRKHGPSKSS